MRSNLRKLSVLLALGMGVTAITPATAASGPHTAVGYEVEFDSGNPPVRGSGPFVVCLRAQDGDNNGTLNGVSARHVIDAVDVDGITHDATMTITTDKTFYFGPQGFHYSSAGPNCTAANLGANVPASITIEIPGTGACTGSGSFSRVNRVFEAEGNCAIGNSNINATFVGEQQQPCTASDGSLLPCLQGILSY